MEYPLIVSGKQLGLLSVHREGLFTVFEARCSTRNELLRISVYGQGREGYLGIMQPWSGGLYLKRKFSRGQMKDFPETIEYAAPAGMNIKKENTKAAMADHDLEEEVLCWYRMCDGSLIHNDGSGIIVALPTKLRRYTPGTVLREIDGRLYMLFRY